MRSCHACGFPSKFARYFDWRSDGTIVSTDRTGSRSMITFLEVEEIEGIFSDLSTSIGMPVDRFLVQAQKTLGKTLYANLPVRHVQKVPGNRFLRPQWLARLLVRMIAPDIAGLGDGRISLDRYSAGETLVLRFKRPCVAPLLTGGAAGMYESLEDMPGSNVEFGLDAAGDLVITLTHSDAAEAEERLYLEEIPPGEGNVVFKRCSGCNVPLRASRALEWRISEGTITNRLTGAREVVIAVQSVNAILRELESELGEDVPNVLRDIQRERTRRRLEGAEHEDPGAFWDEQLMEMAIRGLGYPKEFARGESSVRVEISDAYNQDLYAARVAGALEVLTGKRSTIEWSERHRDRASYEVSVLPD